MGRFRLLVGASIAVAVACTVGNDERSTGTPARSVTAAPSPTVTRPLAPSATLSPTVVSTATPVVADEIPGIFREPRLEEPDGSAALGPRLSEYPPHDRVSVVLYDTVEGTVREFGEGPMGAFSSDGAYMVWEEYADDREEPARLRAIELESGSLIELGPSRGLVRFEDDRTVRVISAESLRVQELVAVPSGQRVVAEDVVNQYGTPTEPGRFVLSSLDIDGSGESVYRVAAGGRVVLAVVALAARLVGDSELLVLVDAGVGLGNLFIVAINTREATFVATTLTEPFIYSTVPLAANESYVVWTPNFCNISYYADADVAASLQLEQREGGEFTRGPTMVYDRTTGTITALSDATLWIAGLTPDGRMIDGGFGGEALIDPASLSWDVVLPDGSTDVSWSPDYRYASRGEQPGHGGQCPP
jgi:hypothetical protein